MQPEIILLLIFLGFLINVIAAMLGIGGGPFIVPALTLIFGLTPRNAAGTSLAVIMITSSASTYGYFGQKRIDYIVGLFSAITSIPGSFAGAFLTTFIPSRTLGIAFAVFLAFVASMMLLNFSPAGSRTFRTWGFWHRRLVDSHGHVFEYDANVLLGSFLSFFGGLSSGLFGIGGGPIMVPILNLAVNLPIHVTVATSTFIIIFTSISGVLTHVILGNVNFEYAAYLAIGGILGAQLGAHVAKRTPSRQLKKFFGVALIIISLNLLFKFLT